MNFFKELWDKDVIKETILLLIFAFTAYFLKDIVDLFLLTFIFTYLAYNTEKFIIKRLKLDTNGKIVTITIYSIIFLILGYFIFKFIPIVINDSMNMINDVVEIYCKLNINSLDKYLVPIIGKINIEDYIKTQFSSIFEFITNIGRWGVNILLALLLSLFFMLEKARIIQFLNKFKTSRISWFCRYLSIFGRSFLNSFGKVIQVQMLIACTNSIFSLIVLSIMGFPETIALGFMIFIFSLIPVIGTIISLIPLSIIAFNIGGFIKVVYVLVAIAILYALENYILNPQFMSVKMQLPVFVVFMVLIISKDFLGNWGLLIGIPLFMFILDILDVRTKEE